MRTALLLPLVAALSACAAADGEWPSLAKRPGELSPQAAAAEAGIGATAAPGATATAASAPVVVSARIAEATADVERAAELLAAAKTNADSAAAAAANAAPGSEAASKAQLELSRLERAGAQIVDLRDRLDALAGDTALAASGGANVAADVAALGRLIARADALRADYDRSFAAARDRLAK
ncbi:MAG: hypothetical protein INF91_09400 [Alphaproteobacteria bacterium]|nr:hypothetical protein [Alphaproteobacteria bacterium]